MSRDLVADATASETPDATEVPARTTRRPWPTPRSRRGAPALDDRDDVVTGGGTPTDDPGDHRGQPWATTPGERGPEEGTDVDDDTVDDGLDVDMAPHSHESEDDEELAEPADESDQDAADARTDDDTAVTDADTRTADAETSDATDDTVDGTADDTADDTVDDTADDTDSAEEPAASGRRVSGFDEVVDGGFGLGSAAPIADGAQPLGHAVKGRRDGTTFVGPDDAGYDDVEPDVWFYSEEAARRAGFHRDGE